MLDLDYVKEELHKFGKYVVKESRANLTRQKKNVSKDLWSSIGYEVTVYPNSIFVEFFMLEYGMYLDEGVEGKNPMRLPANAKQHGKQQAPNSRFKFGDGSGKGLRKGINKWITQKSSFSGQIRDKKGRFIPRKSLQYLITRSIWYSGIKPSMFFTKPFEKAFDNLPDEIIKAYGLDLDKFFEMTT